MDGPAATPPATPQGSAARRLKASWVLHALSFVGAAVCMGWAIAGSMEVEKMQGPGNPFRAAMAQPLTSLAQDLLLLEVALGAALAAHLALMLLTPKARRRLAEGDTGLPRAVATLTLAAGILAVVTGSFAILTLKTPFAAPVVALGLAHPVVSLLLKQDLRSMDSAEAAPAPLTQA